jgi:hypothetical protein
VSACAAAGPCWCPKGPLCCPSPRWRCACHPARWPGVATHTVSQQHLPSYHPAIKEEVAQYPSPWERFTFHVRVNGSPGGRRGLPWAQVAMRTPRNRSTSDTGLWEEASSSQTMPKMPVAGRGFRGWLHLERGHGWQGAGRRFGRCGQEALWKALHHLLTALHVCPSHQASPAALTHVRYPHGWPSWSGVERAWRLGMSRKRPSALLPSEDCPNAAGVQSLSPKGRRGCA